MKKISILFLLSFASSSFGMTFSEAKFKEVLNSNKTIKDLPKEFSFWKITSKVKIKVKSLKQEFVLKGNVKKVQGNFLVLDCLNEDQQKKLQYVIYYDHESKLFVLNKKHDNSPIVSLKGKMRGDNKIIWIGRIESSRLICVETTNENKSLIKETYFDDQDKMLNQIQIEIEYIKTNVKPLEKTK